MSPWASASPIRTLVTADCSCMTPPSSSGTPSSVDAQLGGFRQQLLGRRAGVVGVVGGGADLGLDEGAAALLEHLLLVVGTEVEEAADLLFFWRAGLPSCCAALKVRPAAVAERKPLLVPWKRARSTCLRMRIRSSRSEPARRLSARRPKPMPRSATLVLFSLSVVVTSSSRS